MMPILFIAFAAAAGLGACYYCYRRVFLTHRAETLDPYRLLAGEQYEPLGPRIGALIDHVCALQHEDVFIRTPDGLRLHARYYETAPGAPVQILFHGYRGNALRDFCGGLTLALKNGCNALLIDERGQGQSEGKCLSFGILERKDCLCWIDYARGRFGKDCPIGLMGVSMGAATVLMAGGENLPDNVKAIVADCGYTSAREIICKVMGDMRLPAAAVYPLVRAGARLFGGFDPDETSVPQALERCRVPVLLIHGEDDRFVPCEMSRRNFEACRAEKRLLTVPGAGHGLSYMIDPQAYAGAVTEFLAAHLCPRG